MSDEQTGPGAKAPWSLWVVGAVALLWNGFGTFLWGGSTFSPETFLAEMPAAHRDYVNGLPDWSSFTWGLGVVAGLVGAVLLLARSRLAPLAFALSLFGAVVNTLVYVTNPPPPGFFNPVLTGFIIGFAAFQLWFARRMRAQGTL